MVIRMDATPSGLTVWLSGELDHHSARSLREQVDAAVVRSSATVLRLDFSGVTFMDSSGIGLIMGRYRLLQSRGGKLLVVGVSDRLLRVMKLAGLERLPVWETAPVDTKKKQGVTRK
ncbi:MAG: anti-sigma factor antagonist [Clostridia bacterium]|nr:anti-sigma factor antagonist [Clostridia bacterium]